MIRIAIAEDEKSYYEILEDFIKRFQEETGEFCQVSWFRDGMQLVENYTADYDLILMDVEMPGLNGIEAAKEIRNIDESILIIFITNMAQYAIRGYEVDALDYVVKPLSYYGFALKMKKAGRILRERVGRSILLPFEEETKRIPVKDILYVEIESHTLRYHTYSGISIVTGRMKDVETQLTEKCFARCNQSYIVNLAHVDGIRDECAIVEGTALKISRARKKEFMEKLSEYYSGGGR